MRRAKEVSKVSERQKLRLSAETRGAGDRIGTLLTSVRDSQMWHGKSLDYTYVI